MINYKGKKQNITAGRKRESVGATSHTVHVSQQESCWE
jgi:hypothetical protein